MTFYEGTFASACFDIVAGLFQIGMCSSFDIEMTKKETNKRSNSKIQIRFLILKFSISSSFLTTQP